MPADQETTIAIVVPGNAESGIETVASKLIQGLIQDGFTLKRFSLRGGNALSVMYYDLRLIKSLAKFQVIIYIGSFAWLSHLVLRRSRKLLFVHGFVVEELGSTITRGSVRAKMAAILKLGYWLIFRILNSIDAFVCHSVTSMERNKLPAETILIPQFALPSEFTGYDLLRDRVGQDHQGSFRIVTYTSHSYSPRLIEWNDLVTLARMLNGRTQSKFELVVVDPYSTPKQEDEIRVIPYLPKNEFLRLLGSSDLYFERCTDEELGFGSIESALLGTPVAKITRTKCVGRQDYSKKEILFATSLIGLADEIARALEESDTFRKSYSSRIYTFATSTRAWDNVKSPLTNWIKGNHKPSNGRLQSAAHSDP